MFSLPPPTLVWTNNYDKCEIVHSNITSNLVNAAQMAEKVIKKSDGMYAFVYACLTPTQYQVYLNYASQQSLKHEYELENEK